MEKKFIGIAGLILMPLFGAMLWGPTDASGWGGGSLSQKSIICDVVSWAGNNKETDRRMTCAAKVKEITGFCKNPAFGSVVDANGKPFTVEALVSALSSAEWVRVANKPDEQRLVINNRQIQQALDIYNSLNGNDFIFLQTEQAACKKGWNSFGWAITKADAFLVETRVPSGFDGAGNVISGNVSFTYETPAQCTNDLTVNENGVPAPVGLTPNCNCVAIPHWPFEWNQNGEDGTSLGEWDGVTYEWVKSCNLVGDPFRYCSRFPGEVRTTQADEIERKADSGLRIYDLYPSVDVNNEYEWISVQDKDYRVSDCYLYRDVNKNPEFNLDYLGGVDTVYNPEIDAIEDPQTGNPPVKVKGKETSEPDDNLGGIVLVSPDPDPEVENSFTGECHQHGYEQNGGGTYAWKQSGPTQDTHLNAETGLVEWDDPACRGGSQVLIWPFQTVVQ